VLSPKPLWYTF